MNMIRDLLRSELMLILATVMLFMAYKARPAGRVFGNLWARGKRLTKSTAGTVARVVKRAADVPEVVGYVKRNGIPHTLYADGTALPVMGGGDELQSMTLPQVRDLHKTKADELHKIFEEAGADMDMSKVTSITGSNEEKAAEIRKRNEHLSAIGTRLDELKALEEARRTTEDARKQHETSGVTHPGKKGEAEPERKTIGELFVKSEAYKSKNVEVELDIELKTLFETGAGWAPEAVRSGRIVEDEQRPIQVIDFIPQGNTNQNAVVYMEETTFTNNAAEVAEGGTYGEAALVLTERSDPVQKIGVWIPVTDEQLEDVAQAQSYLNNRLPFMVRQRLDSQILVGDGTAPNISGILDRSGLQTQALGADPVPDAVYKGMTKVEVTGRAFPNLFVTHPNDWQVVRLLRTADGIYIWGSPSEPGPDRIWGLRVLKTTAITENTGLVGDFSPAWIEFLTRRGIAIEVTNAHSDFFIKGKKAIRADIRGSLAVYRPSAFCSITGI